MNITWELLTHPAIFHKKEIFMHNKFDIKYKIAGDYDFFCRTWNEINGNYILPITITKMLTGGISENIENTRLIQCELAYIKIKYFGFYKSILNIIKSFSKAYLIYFLLLIFGNYGEKLKKYFKNIKLKYIQ